MAGVIRWRLYAGSYYWTTSRHWNAYSFPDRTPSHWEWTNPGQRRRSVASFFGGFQAGFTAAISHASRTTSYQLWNVFDIDCCCIAWYSWCTWHQYRWPHSGEHSSGGFVHWAGWSPQPLTIPGDLFSFSVAEQSSGYGVEEDRCLEFATLISFFLLYFLSRVIVVILGFIITMSFTHHCHTDNLFSLAYTHLFTLASHRTWFPNYYFPVYYQMK